LKEALQKLQPQRKTEARAKIQDLTFLETQQLVRDLDGATGADDILSKIGSAWESCTLERHYDTGQGPDGNVMTNGAKFVRGKSSRWVGFRPSEN
jgi:hypothetical protein